MSDHANVADDYSAQAEFPFMRAQVVKPHFASDESQLELKVEDIVYVLEQDPSGWWGGHKEGEDCTGWFPGSCVRQIIEQGDHQPVTPTPPEPNQPSPTKPAQEACDVNATKPMSKPLDLSANYSTEVDPDAQTARCTPTTTHFDGPMSGNRPVATPHQYGNSPTKGNDTSSVGSEGGSSHQQALLEKRQNEIIELRTMLQEKDRRLRQSDAVAREKEKLAEALEAQLHGAQTELQGAQAKLEGTQAELNEARHREKDFQQKMRMLEQSNQKQQNELVQRMQDEKNAQSRAAQAKAEREDQLARELDTVMETLRQTEEIRTQEAQAKEKWLREAKEKEAEVRRLREQLERRESESLRMETPAAPPATALVPPDCRKQLWPSSVDPASETQTRYGGNVSSSHRAPSASRPKVPMPAPASMSMGSSQSFGDMASTGCAVKTKEETPRPGCVAAVVTAFEQRCGTPRRGDGPDGVPRRGASPAPPTALRSRRVQEPRRDGPPHMPSGLAMMTLADDMDDGNERVEFGISPMHRSAVD